MLWCVGHMPTQPSQESSLCPAGLQSLLVPLSDILLAFHHPTSGAMSGKEEVTKGHQQAL